MKIWMAPAGLHVELAAASHVPSMMKLHASCFFHGWGEEDFSRFLSRPAATPVYVACDARHRVAGFMVVSFSGEECELLTIAVHRKWRNRKVGAALLQAGLNHMAEFGAASMVLEVDEHNLAARALYARFGFQAVATRQGYYPLKDGTRASALVMRAPIN